MTARAVKAATGDAGSGNRWDGGGVRGGWADTRSSSLSRCLATSA
jgi:hypothetical protein